MNKQITILTYFMIAFFISHSSKSQSILYNEKRQLNADTTLSITEKQYAAWKKIEEILLWTMSKVEYPKAYQENNVRAKSIYIASFVCDTNNLKDIKVINYSGESSYDPPGFKEAIIKYFQKYGKEVAGWLSSISTEYMGKYYIPFTFIMYDIKEETKKHNAIPIKGQVVPLR